MVTLGFTPLLVWHCSLHVNYTANELINQGGELWELRARLEER